MNEVFSPKLLKNAMIDSSVCVELTEYHLVDPRYGDQIWVDRCMCGSIWVKKIWIKDEKDKEIC
jgi:hypothetical protein